MITMTIAQGQRPETLIKLNKNHGLGRKNEYNSEKRSSFEISEFNRNIQNENWHKNS